MSGKLHCDTVSHAVNPFIHIFLHAGIIGKSHWSGSRPLVSAVPSMLDLHWNSSCTSCCCLCCVEIMQPWVHRTDLPHPAPTPMLREITDGVDIGLDQHIPLVLGLVSPPALTCLCHQGELSSIALTSSPHAAVSKG